MAVQIVITPQTWALVLLLIENALATAFNQISQMTQEEIEAGISVEEAKKEKIMQEINSH